jgi:hypothetical protein
LKSVFSRKFLISVNQHDGLLEIYVPSKFTAERPAVTYTKQVIDTAIEDHPIAKSFPKATRRPSLHPGPQEFTSFATRENAPRTLHDYLSGDVPQLSLHIVSFNNATTVGLSFPHTLMDAMGQQALLRAWSHVLAGREAEVPLVLGAHEDYLKSATKSPDFTREEHFLKPKEMKGWKLLDFTIRFVWDFLWYRSVETRTICLPKATLSALCAQAMGELNELNEKGEKPFISEGDVLTAWGIRAIASSLPQPRPVTAVHAVNTRFRLPSLLNAPGVFLQNMVVGAFTFLSHDLATGPLGPIALENRKHLALQATEQQVLAALNEYQQRAKGHADPIELLFGPSDALLMPCSNWSRADLFKAADFSPAILRKGTKEKSRDNPPGTMFFQHGSAMRQTPTARNFIMIVGKDHGGNCWLTGTLLPPAWVTIEQELKKY